MNNDRLIAANIIREVVTQKTPLSLAMKIHLEKTDKSQHPWIKNIVFYSIRNYFSLNHSAISLLKSPIKNKAIIVHYLLMIGIAQIEFSHQENAHSINATVAAAKKTKFPWAGSLINATLRKYLKDKDIIKDKSRTDESIWNHPKWYINKIKKSWPEHWERVLKENNNKPPFTLRINKRMISVLDFQNLLTESSIQYKTISTPKNSLEISQSIPVEQLPGFTDGMFYVQDSAPQLCASLLNLKAKQKVLDACAAPGGKATSLIEECAEILLTAIDKSPERVTVLQENIERLKLEKLVHIKCLDLSDASATSSLGKFDRILIDAPCTATGIIRRQPDIKIIKDPDSLSAIKVEQANIINNLWSLLERDGELLYATCSIMPEENSLQIKSFLERTPEAQLINLSTRLPFAIDTNYGHQILPGIQNMDGFFFCLLKKK